MKSAFISLWGPLLLALSFAAVSGAATAGEDSLLLAKKHFSFAVQNKKSGDTAEAVRQYEKSLAFCDTLYQVHFSFAELLMAQKRTDRAKAEYLRTLFLNPAHRASAGVLAGMYTAEARYDSALTMYETMYGLLPEKNVLVNIARLRGYLGKNTEGLQAAQSLIDQGEDSPDNLRLAAELASKTGDTELSDHFLLRALEKSPGDRGLLRLGLESSLARGDSSKAAGYLAQLALADSTDSTLLIKWADICRARGDHTGLLRALERRHRLDPRNGGVLSELAEVCIAGKDYSHGEVYVRTGLQITPRDGRLHIILGELYRIRGQKDKALAEYKTAGGDPEWAETARMMIDRMQKQRDDSLKKEKDFFERGKTKTK